MSIQYKTLCATAVLCVMASAPPLSQATGYGIVLGLGFAFALGMVRAFPMYESSALTKLRQVITTWVLKRYRYELQTSEMFSTAGRTVKSGLVASAVVSSWTWAATLLQSSAVAYRYGVSGKEVFSSIPTRKLTVCARAFLVRFRCNCADFVICVSIPM